MQGRMLNFGPARRKKAGFNTMHAADPVAFQPPYYTYDRMVSPEMGYYSQEFHNGYPNAFPPQTVAQLYQPNPPSVYWSSASYPVNNTDVVAPGLHMEVGHLNTHMLQSPRSGMLGAPGVRGPPDVTSATNVYHGGSPMVVNGVPAVYGGAPGGGGFMPPQPMRVSGPNNMGGMFLSAQGGVSASPQLYGGVPTGDPATMHLVSKISEMYVPFCSALFALML